MSGGAAVKAGAGAEGDRPACTNECAEGWGHAPAALALALTARGLQAPEMKGP